MVARELEVPTEGRFSLFCTEKNELNRNWNIDLTVEKENNRRS